MRQFAGPTGFRCRRRAEQGACGFVAALALLAGTSCAELAEPVAAIEMHVARDPAAQGSVVETALSLTVLAAFEPLEHDYRVFVHFLDAGGNLLWADDHYPPIPSSRWRPGQTLSYERRVQIPEQSGVGRATVAVGLYAVESGERLPLAGQALGQRAYRAATVTIAAATERNVPTYGDGWYEPESASFGERGPRWRWTRESAGLTFPNPYSDAVLQLFLDGRPDLVPGGRQELDITVNGEHVRRIVLDSLERQFVEAPLAGGRLGGERAVRVGLHVRQTFVPSEVPGSGSVDDRRLGVRVHHAFVDVR